NRRVLYIFGSGRHQLLVDNQVRLFLDMENDCQERDLDIKPVNTLLDQQKYLKQFGVTEEEFRVMLIGKDGGVKLNSQQPVTVNQIFELIDSMPMRQHEMRQKKEKSRSY
ncbi:MAG: DUF4174 domain-containing protein, partial [Cyclobacteriaceae bacterium]|nr:DUF4174 domain-containing protein [Cyclobacteriaceae bacterium]